MVDRHRFRARIDGELWWEFSRHRSEKTASKIATKGLGITVAKLYLDRRTS